MVDKISRDVFIYGLVDPVTDEIRYVGKAYFPMKRYLQHLKPRKDQKMTPVKSWIISLLNSHLNPNIIYIEKCDETNWEERERFHIANFRNEGNKLTNMADGGNQPACNLETRRQNAHKLNNHDLKGTISILRYFANIIRECKTRGNFDRANMFSEMCHLIRTAPSPYREKFETLGLRKFHG